MEGTGTRPGCEGTCWKGSAGRERGAQAQRQGWQCGRSGSGAPCPARPCHGARGCAPRAAPHGQGHNGMDGRDLERINKRCGWSLPALPLPPGRDCVGRGHSCRSKAPWPAGRGLSGAAGRSPGRPSPARASRGFGAAGITRGSRPARPLPPGWGSPRPRRRQAPAAGSRNTF